MTMVSFFNADFTVQNKWMFRGFRREDVDKNGLITYYANILAQNPNVNPSVQMEYISGLAHYHDLYAGVVENAKVKTYTTTNVVDVRLFPRLTQKGEVMGLKARVYYEGSDYRSRQETIEAIDTPFISLNFFLEGYEKFNSALAQTLMWESVLAMQYDERKTQISKLSVDDPKQPTRSLMNIFTYGVEEPKSIADVMLIPKIHTKTPAERKRLERQRIDDARVWTDMVYGLARCKEYGVKPWASIISQTLDIPMEDAIHLMEKSNQSDHNYVPAMQDFDRAPGVSFAELINYFYIIE